LDILVLFWWVLQLKRYQRKLKIGVVQGGGRVSAKFSRRRRRPPHIILARMPIDSKCLTTLSLTVFTQINFVADFLQAKCDLIWKTAVLRFEPIGGGLRGNVYTVLS